MRLIESVLLIVGAAALGLVTCGLGLAYLGAVTVGKPSPGAEPGTSWGAAFAFLACGSCGGVVGAVAGFVGAVRWLARSGGRPWGAATWTGVALGLTSAVAIRASDLPVGQLLRDLIRWWPGTVLFLIASGALGGLLGSAVGAWWARRAKPPSRHGRKRARRTEGLGE